LFFTPTFTVLLFFSRLERRAPKDAEVRVGISATQARLILAERYVELPMKAVLDRPMATYRGGELLGRELAAHDVAGASRGSAGRLAWCR
jgi:hypothetical protein